MLAENVYLSHRGVYSSCYIVVTAKEEIQSYDRSHVNF